MIQVLYIYTCSLCGQMGGYTLDTEEAIDSIALPCRVCKNRTLGIAFVQEETLVIVRNNQCRNNHRLQVVTKLPLPQDVFHPTSDDYHVSSDCAECEYKGMTIGPNDTNPGWQNWVAYNRLECILR